MKFSKLLPIIGILIFVYILWRIGILKILETLSHVNLFLLSAAILFLIPLIISKAFKWKILINSCDINYPLPKCVSAWLVGFSVGLITPGRVGDFFKVLYLKKSENTTFGVPLATVVVDRIADILILIILAIFGISVIALRYTLNPIFMYVAILLLFIFLVSCFVFAQKDIVGRLIKPLFDRLIPERYRGSLQISFHDFYTGISMMLKSKILLVISFLTVISWLIYIFQCYLIALSLNIDISIQFVACIIPIMTLVELLPISFSGIGTRDATLIFFLSLVAIPSVSAVSFSLMLLFAAYVNGVLGLLFWLKNPIALKGIIGR